MFKLFTAAVATGALVLPSVAGAAPYEVGVNARTVEHEGVDRRYLVYVPAQRAAERVPVVFMFHGSSGTGEQFLRTSGWREEADRKGFVAVFPTGLRYRMLDSGRLVTKWSDFTLARDIDPDGRPPADDVGFVDLILEDLEAELPIDSRRIYASGFSNGAGFAARLSVDRADRIAAAAFSGGGLDVPHESDRAVPTYVTVGSLDDRVLEGTGLTELPLDPVEILASPVLAPFLDAHIQTLGLDPGRFGAFTRQGTTSLHWPAQDPVLQFGMLAGVGHQYPDRLVPEFSSFFSGHRLPAPGRA